MNDSKHVNSRSVPCGVDLAQQSDAMQWLHCSLNSGVPAGCGARLTFFIRPAGCSALLTCRLQEEINGLHRPHAITVARTGSGWAGISMAAFTSLRLNWTDDRSNCSGFLPISGSRLCPATWWPGSTHNLQVVEQFSWFKICACVASVSACIHGA
jgi:hypothetical protein